MIERFSLDGRVALLTGAGGTLGPAFARALADAGARVLLTGRDLERLDALTREVGSEKARVIRADLRQDESIERLFDDIEREEAALDILVNNAGVASRSTLEDLSAEEFHRVLHLNVVAAALCARRAVPLMRARGGGKIINIGSIYGTVAADPALYEGARGMVQCSPPYAASKSALVNLTRDLAVRLAPWNIQVNLISPGGIEQDQPAAFKRNYAARTPSGRLGSPGDVVGTLVYLAGSAADYVTGQNIHVDGGFTAW